MQKETYTYQEALEIYGDIFKEDAKSSALVTRCHIGNNSSSSKKLPVKDEVGRDSFAEIIIGSQEIPKSLKFFDEIARTGSFIIFPRAQIQDPIVPVVCFQSILVPQMKVEIGFLEPDEFEKVCLNLGFLQEVINHIFNILSYEIRKKFSENLLEAIPKESIGRA
jgi:hypothetical protein